MGAIYALLGKPKPLARINIAEKLEEYELAKHFPSTSWPEPGAVRELITKVKNLSGDGFQNPFIYADLRKYASNMCLG